MYIPWTSSPSRYPAAGCAWLAVVVVCLTSLGVRQAHGQGHGHGHVPGPDRFVRWMVGDALAFVRAPDARVPVVLLGGATLLAPMSMLDRAIGQQMGKEYTGAFAAYADVTNELGGPSATPYVGAVFLASLATRNPRLQDAAFTSMQSLLYTGALSYGIKYAAGRVRPEDDDDPFRFDPFSGHSSFPSGHTSAAFAILTPWALYYPHPATYAALAVGAGGTALSRIARGKHWATDVIAGGGLGFMTAYWLSRRHQAGAAGAPSRASLTVLPAAGPEAVSLTVSVRF